MSTNTQDTSNTAGNDKASGNLGQAAETPSNKVVNPYAKGRPSVVNPYAKGRSSSTEKNESEKVETNDEGFGEFKHTTYETGSNYKKAINAFNNFQQRQQKVPTYEKITHQFLETYTIVTLFLQFASYLFLTYDAAVAPNYLSYLKTLLERKFQSLSFFQRNQYSARNKLEWYTKIYHDLSKAGFQRNVSQGKSMTKKKPPILRDLLNRICLELLSENTHESIFNSVLMPFVRSSVGRPCELALCTWNGLYFNSRAIQLQWKRSKTYSETPMTLPPDIELMTLCPFHCLGRYLITFSGQFKAVGQEEENIRWLFPQLKGIKEKMITNRITQCLHRLAKKGTVIGLTEDFTGYAIKHGAIDDMTYTDTSLNEQQINNRATWNAKNIRTYKPGDGNNRLNYVSFDRDVMQGGKFFDYVYIYYFHSLIILFFFNS